MPRVRRERSGWRDEGLSRRHREWGWDCPAIDIDFLMLEYDTGEPVAVVEYKHESAKPVDPSHASYRAILALTEAACIPFFVVRYKADFSYWRVTPVGRIATQFLSEPRTANEQQYVRFLYWLRGRVEQTPCLTPQTAN